MNYIYINFLIFIFLKQFYIFKSGGLQIADIFFIISFVGYFFANRGEKKKGIKKIDIYIVIFLILVTIINLIYMLIYNKNEFLVSTFHWIYISLFIVLFRNLMENKIFLQKLLGVVKISILTQLGIYICGLGRYYYEIRYMGTFNDPNQLSFFLYSALMISVLLSDILQKRISIIYYGIGFFLIFRASSTGMIMGLLIFVVLTTILNYKKKLRISLRKFYTLFIVLGILLIVIIPNINNIESYFSESLLITRVYEKINKFSFKTDDNGQNLIQERGIDKIVLYPQKVILGAGQGYYERFTLASHNNEIHSTILSILFYYGIIPTSIIIIWIIKNIKNVPSRILGVYISLIAESLTLLNQRQPFFWMIFMLGALYSNRINMKK